MTKQLTIYAVRGCKYSNAAVEFARNRSLDHEVRYLDTAKARVEIRGRYNHKTWPVIVEVTGAGERLVGGYQQLVTMWQSRNQL